MPDADGARSAPARAASVVTESSESARPRRIRLVKALAAMARAKPKASDPASPQRVSRRCKLEQHEEAMLAELKQRLHKAGVDMRKGDLLRAGLLALAGFDDARLREVVARLDAGAPSESLPSLS